MLGTSVQGAPSWSSHVQGALVQPFVFSPVSVERGGYNFKAAEFREKLIIFAIKPTDPLCLSST